NELGRAAVLDQGIPRFGLAEVVVPGGDVALLLPAADSQAEPAFSPTDDLRGSGPPGYRSERARLTGMASTDDAGRQKPTGRRERPGSLPRRTSDRCRCLSWPWPRCRRLIDSLAS